MNIGRLDRRIELQASTATTDTFGAQTLAWESLGKRWARRDDNGGAETTQAGELVAINRVVYTLRYEPGLTARLRIVDDGQTYDIDNVSEIGRKHGLKLTAFTRNDQADAR